MGETIRVVVKNDLMKRTNSHGEAHYRFNEIQLNPDEHKDILESTLFHEFTHFILNKMGEKDLSDNERFICVFSGLLYQALKECLK